MNMLARRDNTIKVHLGYNAQTSREVIVQPPDTFTKRKVTLARHLGEYEGVLGGQEQSEKSVSKHKS